MDSKKISHYFYTFFHFYIKRNNKNTVLCYQLVGCFSLFNCIAVSMNYYSAQSELTDSLPSCECIVCLFGCWTKFSNSLIECLVKKIICTDHG